jgi:predicted ATPase/DNA-binding SARP family transcriptional activator
LFLIITPYGQAWLKAGIRHTCTEASAMPELHIQLLRDFHITYGEAPVCHLNAPRLQALLAYLVLHCDAPQPRYHLAFRLWPDTTEAQARTNLRQLVHGLKQTLPEADQFIDADAQTLQWQGDAPFRLDVAEFEAALTQADVAERHGDPHALRAALEQAVAVYHGDLLPSCYDDWIRPERERLRQAFTGALERLMLLLERQDDPRAAIACAEGLLRHDPLREDTYRALMRQHAACGDRAGALRVYHTCATVLERELGAEPSAATREVYEQLLKVGVPTRPAMPAQPANTNLPVPLTSFVGREAEMAKVRRLLPTTRLLTLTGPGGCGKTRLALEVATNLLDDYPDGVWWVELAALSNPSLVPQAVATALGVREQSDRPLPETLVDYLRARQLLLLLDNCEHLVGACACLAEQLLSVCPHLRILATSREALSIGGETTWLVPSLNLPEAQSPATVDELSCYEAIRLFVERAATVLPTFRLTAANAPSVVQVCRRLDGIPLAIELAAARVKVLHVEQLAARLDDVFHLLTAGSRTALLRHQTLRAALDWSHDLLSERERILFRRLAVFAGGFTLEAAEAVCAGAGLETGEVLDMLSHLVDKSLVAVTPEGGTRYRLLETIRQYSQEQLERAGETGPFYLRQVQWCLKLVAGAEAGLRGAEQVAWFEQLETEHDNLRAGLSRATEPAMQLQLVTALFYFWSRRGYLSEGRRWLAMALGNAESLKPTPTHAKALYSAGLLAFLQGDPASARSLAVQSIAVSRQLGDTQSCAYALTYLGLAAAHQGDLETAHSVGRESVAMFREVGDVWGLAIALHCLGWTTRMAGDHHLAPPLIEESMALFRMVGDQWGVALVLLNMGILELLRQNYPAARAAFEASLTSHQQIGDTWAVNMARDGLGEVALKQGDCRTARLQLQAALSSRRDLGDKQGIADALAGLAAVARAQGQLRSAATLSGASEALFESIGSRASSFDRANFSDIVADLSKTMGENEFARIWADGRAMPLEQVIADALSLTAE